MAPLAESSDGEAEDDLGVSFLFHAVEGDNTYRFCRYKILFLDVLFPLELDRVIFVDSDQVSALFKLVFPF
jgi:hypothetical protein